MKQALIKKGKVLSTEVPAPIASKGCLLIKTVNSCISAGTEMGSVNTSGMNLIKRAIKQPQNVNLVFNSIKQKGISKVYAKVKGELTGGKATGYSLSGVVVGIGKDVTDYKVGDHVTAAGAGIANHAEYVDVPVNLTTKMPVGMSFIEASTVTLGAIALQGVRRADFKMGEFGVVVGAGILGLLTVQMLKASGVRVAAIDFDNSRLAIAKKLGVEMVFNPNESDPVLEINNWTGGYGADAVIFTATSSSSKPLSQSFNMCRRKGKVVLVGVVGMEIKREDIFKNELDFCISTSYGPGRYDTNYEIKGNDYPYAYVRWTENRNMMEYLRMVHSKEIKLEKLINGIYPIDNVSEAYESLKDFENKPLMVILDYGEPVDEKIVEDQKLSTKIIVGDAVISKDIINVALIGGGSFAVNTHLPNFAKLKNKYKIHAIVDRKGANATNIANQFGASYSTTNIKEVLQDKEVDLVLISTRHDSHASITMQALEAGKHVFVEKPLATSPEELQKIKDFYKKPGNKKPILFVGFNRRFCKYAQEIKKHTDNRINPLFIRYKMNAGYIPMDHWVHEYGGRIVGEACHIIDLMTFFTGSKIISIATESMDPNNNKFSMNDNRSMILKYEDGSVCNIDYFAVGSKKYCKEFMEIHFDEKTIEMNNYKSLKGFGLAIKEMNTKNSQKGQLEELFFLYDSLKGKIKGWPVELWDMLQTTEATFLIEGNNE